MKKEDILRIEMNHISLFSKAYVKQSGFVFFDERLRDKYFHNYFHVFKEEWIEEELKEYEKQHQEEGFVIFRFETEKPVHLNMFNDYTKEHYAYYQAKIDELVLNPKIDPDIQSVDPMKDDAFFEFLYQDALPYGESYARGNARREKEVLSQFNHYFYLKVMHHGDIIGHLNAHVEEHCAKIDEFYIDENFQKKGFGTAIMKHMLDKLKQRNVKEVYLVTDLVDTAQELYEKMGYKRVGTFIQYKKMFKD